MNSASYVNDINQNSSQTTQHTNTQENPDPKPEQRLIFGHPNVKELKETNPALCCVLCKRPDVNHIELGMLLQLENVIVHHYCLLFSSNLVQRGDENSGIFAFTLSDIMDEVDRGKKLRCKYCNLTGGTIGCNNKKCRTSFHYICGHQAGVQFQFKDNSFLAYCPNHREYQEFPFEIETVQKSCPICMDDINIAKKSDYLLFPCCGHTNRTLFHRTCIMGYAYNSGFKFFKCPLCGLQDANIISLLKGLGINIPEQDAAWERTDNYADQYNTYKHCDITPCYCPNGRDFEGKLPCTTESSRLRRPRNINWIIARCKSCGSKGGHVPCLPPEYVNDTSEWECVECENVGRQQAEPDYEIEPANDVDNVDMLDPEHRMEVEPPEELHVNGVESQSAVELSEKVESRTFQCVNVENEIGSPTAQPQEASPVVAKLTLVVDEISPTSSSTFSSEIVESQPPTSTDSETVWNSNEKVPVTSSPRALVDNNSSDDSDLQIVEVKMNTRKKNRKNVSAWVADHTVKLDRFYEIVRGDKKKKRQRTRVIPLGSSNSRAKRVREN